MGSRRETARRLPAGVRVLRAALARDRRACGAYRRGAAHRLDRRHPRRASALVGSAARAAVRRREETVHRRRASRRRPRGRSRTRRRARADGTVLADPAAAARVPGAADERRGVPRIRPSRHVQGGHRLSRRDAYSRPRRRVHVADPAARRRFRRYWLVIRPFSGLIRILLLRAARRRAEAPA